MSNHFHAHIKTANWFKNKLQLPQSKLLNFIYFYIKNIHPSRVFLENINIYVTFLNNKIDLCFIFQKKVGENEDGLKGNFSFMGSIHECRRNSLSISLMRFILTHPNFGFNYSFIRSRVRQTECFVLKIVRKR